MAHWRAAHGEMACSPLLIESQAVRRSQGGCRGDAASDAPRAGRAGPSPLAARSGDGGGGGWRVVPRVSLLGEERPAQCAARREGGGCHLCAAVQRRGGERGPAGQEGRVSVRRGAGSPPLRHGSSVAGGRAATPGPERLLGDRPGSGGAREGTVAIAAPTERRSPRVRPALPAAVRGGRGRSEPLSRCLLGVGGRGPGGGPRKADRCTCPSQRAAPVGAPPLRGTRQLRPATREASAAAGRNSAFPAPASSGLRDGPALVTPFARGSRATARGLREGALPFCKQKPLLGSLTGSVWRHMLFR